MPIRGTFEADFTSFTTAVQKADVELRSFESDANKVTTSLAKMTDSVSGRRMVQEATLMAEAVERIGGVTKLTEAELERLGAKAQEAAAKMRAIGVDVPANLQRIADAAKPASSAMASFAASVASTATGVALGGGLAAAAQSIITTLTHFTASVIEAGDEIQKLADKTDLTTDEVQQLQHVAEQSGTGIDALVVAMQNVQQRMGDGDAGLVGAVKKLNLNFGELQRLSPWEMMTTLAEALRGVQDPAQRAALAADIFGKPWKEVLPAIKSGMKELGAEAPRMSDTAVKGLDAIGDAWAALKRGAVSYTGEIVGRLVDIAAHAKHAGDALGEYMLGVSKIPAMPPPPQLPDFSAPAESLHQYAIVAESARLKLEDLNVVHARHREELAREQKALTDAKVARERYLDQLKASFTGDDTIKKAQDLIDAFSDLNSLTNMSYDQAKRFAQAMADGEDAMVRQGRASDDLTGRMDTYRLKALETVTAVEQEIAALRAKTQATEEAAAAANKAAAAEAAPEIPKFIPTGPNGTLGFFQNVFSEKGIGGYVQQPPQTSGYTINNTYNVNGTGEQVYAQFKDQLTRDLMPGNRWNVTR